MGGNVEGASIQSLLSLVNAFRRLHASQVIRCLAGVEQEATFFPVATIS
jgi:hypothetical protein